MLVQQIMLLDFSVNVVTNALVSSQRMFTRPCWSQLANVNLVNKDQLMDYDYIRMFCSRCFLLIKRDGSLSVLEDLFQDWRFDRPEFSSVLEVDI